MESHLGQAGVSEVLFRILDCIFRASQLSTGLQTALASRAVELSWRQPGCLRRRLVTLERVHERVVEQAVALPVLPLKVDVPATQTRWETLEVIQPVLVERIKGRVVDRVADIPVPLAMEEIQAVQEVVKLVPQERVQQRAVEHVKVPQLLEETVEVVLAPTERVQLRTVEEIVDVPQILDETVEVLKLVPKKRVQWIDEQLVEVLIPQISGDSEQIVDVPGSGRGDRGSGAPHASRASATERTFDSRACEVLRVSSASDQGGHRESASTRVQAERRAGCLPVWREAPELEQVWLQDCAASFSMRHHQHCVAHPG